MMVDHLWQSSLFAALIWIATLVLRSNAARVRYWLWTAASVKFLVPFSWLIDLAARFEWRTAAPIAAQPAVSFVADEVLAAPLSLAPMSTSAATVLQPAPWAWLLTGVWFAGAAAVVLWWGRGWVPVRRALRTATPLALESHPDSGALRVLSSPSMFEPGVVGIWRPVLLVPNGLIDRLTPAQLNALMAHERSHIRHHDNLAAVLHMLVEALFWFHPLVWWIERRMIDERERGCDEAVLRCGSQPEDYAAGILAVCTFTVEAPLMCVTGITGADLRRRVETIMRGELGRPLAMGARVALAVALVSLIVVPIAAGVLDAAPLVIVGQEPEKPVVFEVASVKQNRSGEVSISFNDEPGGRFVGRNVPLGMLITHAYAITRNQLIGAPGWISSDRFDIDARLDHEPPTVPAYQAGERQFALRSLLAERFKLVVHRETRQVPMYALVMANPDGKPGPKLTPSTTDCSPAGQKAIIAAVQAGKPLPGMCGTRINTGRIAFGGYPLSDFVKVFGYDGRSLVDRTGLTGNWDLELTFAPDPRPGQETPVVDPNLPSLPTAFQEQLGLKLEPITGPMEVLVVDRVERLIEN